LPNHGYPLIVPRIERRLLQVTGEIVRLRRELELVEGELGMHRHLADDAARDAVVSGAPADRAESRDVARDVARLEGAREAVVRGLERLEIERDRLLDRLGQE
jgi:hypothetical protein